jgi:hypothetical protein
LRTVGVRKEGGIGREEEVGIKDGGRKVGDRLKEGRRKEYGRRTKCGYRMEEGR